MKLVERLRHRFWIDKHTRKFIGHNRAKWNRNADEEKKAVVLVDLFDSNPELYCFSHLTNYVAEKTGACIRSYVFARGPFSRLGLPWRRLESIYESFGAKLGPSFRNEGPYLADARAFADKTFAELRSGWDVLNLKIEGIPVGELVYDSYLRPGHYTIDLKDPALREILYDAYLVTRISIDYFKTHDVKAMFITHFVYISHGIIRRVAAAHGVPVYFIMDNGDLQIREIKPEMFYQLRYREYPRLFQALPDEKKPSYLAQARDRLTARLQGQVDRSISYMSAQGTMATGYSEASSGRLLKPTDAPKIVILPHCFFDAPHGYGNGLFPDFWVWINHLLEKASKTPFEWYIKPHPAWEPKNEPLMALLRERYPKLRVLDRTASNRQLIGEGIKAMFTVHGTAGHEFAYLGIPVVNAAENPHIAYDFNLHPSTIKEYDECIANADRLHSRVNLDKSRIEEYFYMRNFWEYPKNEFGARCIDEELDQITIGLEKANASSTLTAYAQTETPDKEKRIRAYFDHFFAPYLAKTAPARPNPCANTQRIIDP